MNRTIEHILPIPGGVEILCGCGHLTELTFDIEPGSAGTVERAFTCDGCLTPHWFTLTIPAAGETP